MPEDAWIIAAVVLALAAMHLFWRRRLHTVKEELVRCQRERAAEQTVHSEKLGREQARQQVVFNSMSEGILLIDPDSRIRLANEPFKKLFRAQSDIEGLTIMEALRSPELAALFESLQHRDTFDTLELDLPGLSAASKPCIEVNGSVVFDETGRRHGVVFVFRDITRLRQLENARKEFVANVSHELRTPLSMIKGYVETLIDSGSTDRDQTEQFLQTIKKHADRLAYLIEDLLTLSRLESGQTLMNLEAVKLRTLVGDVIEDLETLASQKRVRIENKVPLELAVRADADRIRQVLFNLVENAIKYGRVDGNVRIGARPISNGAIQVSVADDGPGIPPEAKERVFERFYRVDRARSRDTGGTGLGLSIVKHIVQAHGGKVWVESKLEHGSTFVFTLPGLIAG